MNSLKRYPFVRLLLPFLLGVTVLSIFPQLPNISWWWLGALLLVLSLFAFSKSSLQRFHYEWIFGILLFAMLFLFGWKRTADQHHFIDETHFATKDSVTAGIAFVEVEPAEKERSWKSTLTMRYIRENGTWTSSSGSLIAYFAKDNLQTLPKTGDCIIFFTPPDNVPPALNPHAFNYRNYLEKKRIAHRVYLTSDSWQLVDEKAPFSILRIALQLRSKILHVLEDSPLTEEEYGVAAAILLGYNDKLDSDLRQTYSNSGASHILCVSGMHVGVIFLIINTLLAFLNRKKHGRIIKAILLFLFIWSYAFLTGLSAAVLRATIMISFVVFSNAFRRPKEIWNTIAASAFFILIVNPNLLTDIGFQLSYAAVIAIIALQPKISKWINCRTWLGRNVWDLVAVSLAAQIGTAPLSIYYFHQFPTFFIATNLIVMPLSTIIIYNGVALLLLSFIPFLKTFLGTCLFYEIRFLNHSMEWITQLPGSLIENINLWSVELIAIYLIIICFSIFCIRKTARPIYFTLLASIVFAACLLFKNYTFTRQSEIIAFESGKSPAIAYVQGRKMVVVTDSTFINNKLQQSFTISGYRIHQGIKDITLIPNDQTFADSSIGLFVHHQYAWFQDHRFTISEQKERHQIQPFITDYLLIRNSRYGKTDEYLSNYHCDNILVDASNSRQMQQQWQLRQQSTNEHIHLLSKDGAFVKDFYGERRKRKG